MYRSRQPGILNNSVVEPEPRAKEPKLNGLLEPEPKLNCLLEPEPEEVLLKIILVAEEVFEYFYSFNPTNQVKKGNFQGIS